MRVWESKLDGKYDVFVERIKDREAYSVSEGVLKVVNTETNEVLLSDPVKLSYGAIFGPDVDDVQLWQEMGINAVDSQAG